MSTKGRLLGGMTLFFTPVFFLYLLPSYFLWKSKEDFHKIDQLISGKEKYLIGYLYEENKYHYLKWACINENERKYVWALGSSRVLQFRSNMFDSSFYNAGYSSDHLVDYLPFLKSLPTAKYPKYIVLGLDDWMFNPESNNNIQPATAMHWQNSFNFYPAYITYKSMLGDLYDRKITFASVQNADKDEGSICRLGMNAVANDLGFRTDGSIYYGGYLKKLLTHDTCYYDYRYARTLRYIRDKESHYEAGRTIDLKAIDELSELLSYCKMNQITVVGFIAPMADSIYRHMTASGDYDYLKEVNKTIQPVFEQHHYELYDFSTTSQCNSNERELIDALHGGEITYQRILIKMLEGGSVLNKVTNLARLKRDLMKAKNNYVVYEY